MRILRDPKAFQRLCGAWRRRGLRVGFVPTMGALHEGHLSLLRRSRRECDRTVASIFVNPLQFGPAEDLSRYPRPFRLDAAGCRRAGVDALFCPSPRAMYPRGFRTRAEVDGLSTLLCGAFRPGHFQGVATVVLKLLNLASPDSLYMGEKDFQQLVIVRRMARDLDLPVRVVGCPTVREADGLAMSSRNAYLCAQEREEAARLHRALRAGAARARRGAALARVLREMRREVRRIPGVVIDYLELVDAETLLRPARLKGRLRLLGAIRLRNTRLIDNIPLLM
ncbi:MAG: pantoate--beta-alanine ligase [Elusimicrobiota bacterium]